MKGIIFTTFSNLVEEKFGPDTWDSILTEVSPESDGIYTTAGDYPDGELISLVGALSDKTSIPADDLVRAFGEYTILNLANAYPSFYENVTAKDFLLRVHDTIHVEVKKLYPRAELPEFLYEDPGPDQLVMLYRSPRKLCALAEGMIQGTASYFGVEIATQQSKCLHNGDDHCRLELSFGGTQ